MNDYFKDISDWDVGESHISPTCYLEFDDIIEFQGMKFRYHYSERDWNVLGYSPEENKAMGRACVIQINKEDLPMKAEHVSPCYVVYGNSFERAINNFKNILSLYMEIKDLTSGEFHIWRKGRYV